MTEAAPRLKILFTNISLRGRSGTEMMTAELAIALHRRGHEVTIYSPRIGLLARDIMARGVAVTDQIAQLTTVPDIIHGHHNTALATAMVRFPASRAIFVCHDSAMGYDAPVIDPRIGAYVAVDAACAARLGVAGVAAADIALIPNAVDLAAFPLRARIADQPASALAITKTLAPWLDAARLACEVAGLAFEAVGPGAGGSVSDLASRMAKADIVFAWSSSAAEAAASGAAVIMCDEFGFGGMLTAAQAEAYPAGPLGRRILSHAATPDAMTNAIAAYHAADIARTAVVVRKKLSLEHMLTRYEALYRDVLAQPPVDPGETAGLAAFIASAMPRFDLPAEIEVAQEALAARLIRLDAWIAGQAAPPASIQFSQAGLGAALLGDGWGRRKIGARGRLRAVPGLTCRLR